MKNKIAGKITNANKEIKIYHGKAAIAIYHRICRKGLYTYFVTHLQGGEECGITLGGRSGLALRNSSDACPMLGAKSKFQLSDFFC